MDRIGKYQITGDLGTGGFGRVYKALDPTMGRSVAIKVLNVLDDPVLVKRFKTEAMTSASLQHKNIVTIHEFGEDGGKPFLVMEYLQGTNLQLLIKQGSPLPALDKLLIMSEVCQGLEYAHKHGVVHRDVKPANIMRVSDGGVKIMDFGIARMVRDVNPRLTQTGYIVGTPQYMAPEQFASEAADAQCDVWAYGVVLYEFLSGTNPFEAAGAPQVMYRVTTEQPPPIQLPDQPAGLTPLLSKLLAKSRKDRYSSMEEVRFDLELVIRELKHARVEGLSHTAETLIHEERLDEALSVVREILELDRSNVPAHGWRKELTGRIRMRSLMLRVQELVEQAEAEAATRRYGSAADRLEEALRLDANNNSIRQRMEEFRAEWEKIQRAAALVAEARMELVHQALTSAFEHASEAAAADPRSEAARALIDEVRAAMARRELEARRKGGLGKANGLILVQDYEAAAAVLKELAEEFPGDPEIQAKLEEAKRLGAVHAAVNESKEMIRRGWYQRAIDVLRGVDPRIPQVSALLAYAKEQLEAEDEAARQRDEERRAIAQRVEACRALLLAGNLDAASARSAELAAKYPGGAGVSELREEVARLVNEREERRRREAERQLSEQRAEELPSLEFGGLLEPTEKVEREPIRETPRAAERPLEEGLPEVPRDPVLVADRAAAIAPTGASRPPAKSSSRWLAISVAIVLTAVGLLSGFWLFPHLRESRFLALQAAFRQVIEERRWTDAQRQMDEYANGKPPGDAAVSVMRGRIEQGKQAELTSLQEAIGKSLTAHQWAQAGASIGRLEQVAPADSRIAEWRKQVESGIASDRDLDGLRLSIRHAIGERNWTEADKGITSLLARVPGDPQAAEWRASVARGRQAGLEAKVVSKQEEERDSTDLANAEELFRQGHYPAAIDLFQQVLRRNGGNTRARKGLKQAQDAKATEDRVFGRGQ